MENSYVYMMSKKGIKLRRESSWKSALPQGNEQIKTLEMKINKLC